MKKKFNVGLVLALVLLAVNIVMITNNQRMSALLKTQQTKIAEHMEEIEHDVQTIQEQQIKIKEMEQYIQTIQNEQSELLEEMEAKKEEIKSLEFKISRYMESTPFEMLKITGIQNESSLKQNKVFPERHFNGTISLSWDDIPNASGYQIEFNYSSRLEKTTDTYYYCTGGFYSYKIDISEGLKFRIRAYNLQDGKEVYGEFSEWIPLEVE